MNHHDPDLSFDPELLQNCDLYLHWAVETEYSLVLHDCESESTIGLLIEWRDRDAAYGALRVANRMRIEVPGAYTGHGSMSGNSKIRRVWAITLEKKQLGPFLRDAGALALRIELAMPMAESPLEANNINGRQSTTEVLAAVLDDGCAFANSCFRVGASTRVLWLWNQDRAARGAPLAGNNGPSPAANLGYGGQFSRDDLDAIYPGAVQSQDEAYREAGLAGLRRQVSHGAHVLDMLAHDQTWDIVFVQFPLRGINDPSGIWLKRHAIDGLRYVLECAGPNTSKVVVNISWGPQTGPHDGNSLLETGIAEMVQEQAQLPKPRKLLVSLPSGNSFGSQAHACVSFANGGSFDWYVPPDGEIPAFIELWWPSGVLPSQVKLKISPPSDPTGVVVQPGINVASDPSWWARLKQIGPYAKMLVVLRPTGGPYYPGRMHGRHGRWHFHIDPTVSGPGSIHVYVARADHNMGARRRAKASYLCDVHLDGARFGAPAARDDEVTASSIRRIGTLNGMATGNMTFTASGYVSRGFQNARYGSAGPTRDARFKPDYACMTDRTPVRLGVRASGVRSGTTAVLIGTSTAAPQLGRMLALGLPPIAHVPVPPCPERVGQGCLPPDPRLIRPE